MEPITIFVVVAVIVALVFDFTNGMHDSANSISTIVATRVLSPRLAVVWAAFFNFVAFAIFGTAVAKTIGSGMIDLKSVTVTVIFCGLLGAIGWNLFTWYKGLPTSSSHALIGGYAGAAIANAGFGVIIPGGWVKTLEFIILAPAIGLFLGYFFKILSSWAAYKNALPALPSGRAYCNCFPRRFTVWGTAGTTRKKPWESLPVCFIRAD